MASTLRLSGGASSSDDPEDLSKNRRLPERHQGRRGDTVVTRRHTHRAVPQAARAKPVRRGSTTSLWWQPPMRSPPAPAEDRLRPARHVPRRARGAELVSRAPWVAHFGLDRTPFGKSIAAKDCSSAGTPRSRRPHQLLHRRVGHRLVTGDVGAGKTVSVRAAVSSLDPTRHQVIYIANPAFGTRGLYVTIVRSLGAEPST